MLTNFIEVYSRNRVRRRSTWTCIKSSEIENRKICRQCKANKANTKILKGCYWICTLNFSLNSSQTGLSLLDNGFCTHHASRCSVTLPPERFSVLMWVFGLEALHIFPIAFAFFAWTFFCFSRDSARQASQTRNLQHAMKTSSRNAWMSISYKFSLMRYADDCFART